MPPGADGAETAMAVIAVTTIPPTIASITAAMVNTKAMPEKKPK